MNRCGGRTARWPSSSRLAGCRFLTRRGRSTRTDEHRGKGHLLSLLQKVHPRASSIATIAGVEMDEAQTTRQPSLYRNLSLAMTFLALIGWGTAYFARASSAIQQQLRGEVAQLKATQDQFTAERDQAQAQLAAAQQEAVGLTRRLEELEAKASVTGSVSPPIPASKPPR